MPYTRKSVIWMYVYTIIDVMIEKSTKNSHGFALNSSRCANDSIGKCCTLADKHYWKVVCMKFPTLM